MNNIKLDPFETALLVELRREVAEHPAPEPTPRRHPRRRLKMVAAGALATAAATVAAIGLAPGSSPTASPAFAVEANADGSVNLVVYRLDDAAGLEAALAEHGIDATVHFVPTPDGQVPPFEADGPFAHDAPGPQNSCGIDNGPGPAMLVPSEYAHGLGKNRPALGRDLDVGRYVLQLPADSVLFDRPVSFYIGNPGSMSIVYPSSRLGEWCGFGQSQIFGVDSSGKG